MDTKEHTRLLRLRLDALSRELGMLAAGSVMLRNKGVNKNLRRAEQSVKNALACLPAPRS
jgi:hypothetical protein